MNDMDIRNKHVGRPGNGGQFAPSTNSESDVTLNRPTMQTDEPIVHLALSSSNRSLEELVHNMGTGMLTSDTPYQRGHVWSRVQRQNMLKSILSGVPIPAVIINERRDWPGITDTEPWDAVVDGKQRLETARQWFDGSLTVPASWFDSGSAEETVDTDDGPYVSYKGLSLPARRHFRNRALIPVVIAKLPSIQDEAALYVQVNTSGVDQTEEDIENARRLADS